MTDSSHPENDGAADMLIRDTLIFNGTGSPTYSGVPGADATVPKTCSNVKCHFGAPTPRWSCPADPE
jgi:hypothetical protein